MRQEITNLLHVALANLAASGQVTLIDPCEPQVEHAKDPAHGDFTTNLALLLAKIIHCKPYELAQIIVTALPTSPLVAQSAVAGPGFINFFLTADAYLALIPKILQAQAEYGRSQFGHGQQVQVEFVSANPTGPLHVGHGRGAAYGAIVADLLEAIGYTVQREYYVNDAGRQMDILATSIWLRYLELCGESINFPQNSYRGDYVRDMAANLHREHGNYYLDQINLSDLKDLLNSENNNKNDSEVQLDKIILITKQLLETKRYRQVFELGLQTILADIRDDLLEFGVVYQTWYSEHSLTERGAVIRAFEKLQANGYLYEQDRALWFRSTAFGDDKDRVIVRENGQFTYFASDIAYHLDKFERGFNKIIDIWGADHHGYIKRIKAALQALGYDPERLQIQLVQFAILYRGGEKVQMSTRSGEFVTLRALRNEVGKDAARFFYVMRRCEQHLDFDLDLAKSESADNPVYYIQYAYARICNVVRQARDQGFNIPNNPSLASLTCLNEGLELTILKILARYSETIETAALKIEPHRLTQYLRELATEFHSYYNAHQFLVESSVLRTARLALILAVQQVLHNGLILLGVSAPENM